MTRLHWLLGAWFVQNVFIIMYVSYLKGRIDYHINLLYRIVVHISQVEHNIWPHEKTLHDKMIDERA